MPTYKFINGSLALGAVGGLSTLMFYNIQRNGEESRGGLACNAHRTVFEGTSLKLL